MAGPVSCCRPGRRRPSVWRRSAPWWPAAPVCGGDSPRGGPYVLLSPGAAPPQHVGATRPVAVRRLSVSGRSAPFRPSVVLSPRAAPPATFGDDPTRGGPPPQCVGAIRRVAARRRSVSDTSAPWRAADPVCG